MTQQINPVKYLSFILLAAVIGAVIGGMYTKIRFLEAGYSGAEKVVAAAPGEPVAPAQPNVPQAPTKVDIQVTPDDSFKGSANAKLTIVEFGDYQCPFCGRFFEEIEPQIIKDYVESGKARFVYKNLAFLGKESTDAANAALCAKEQNKFWEYHDKIYNSQSGENQGAFSIDNLKKFAADLGLETVKFDSCLDSQKYNSQVEVDIAEAKKNGFQSTPSTAIGSTPLIGAQPYAQFKAAIEAELTR